MGFNPPWGIMPEVYDLRLSLHDWGLSNGRTLLWGRLDNVNHLRSHRSSFGSLQTYTVAELPLRDFFYLTRAIALIGSRLGSRH